MKKVLLPILAVTLFIAIVGLITQKLQNQTSSFNESPPPSVANKISINQTEISVELADTAQKRERGLSKRESLSEGEGMLFVFKQENIRQSFWMKDMNFAIDIIWISDEEIIQIDEKVPPPEPGTPDSELKSYLPNQPIDYVLEVNAGFSDENNIKIGDPVKIY